MLKNSLALALASVALLAAPTVSAQQTETRTTGISYDDLDLHTTEGREELDRRIDRAAREVCDLDQSVVGTRIRSRYARECFRDAKRQLARQFAQVIENQQKLGG